jgi:hypothetical protein
LSEPWRIPFVFLVENLTIINALREAHYIYIGAVIILFVDTMVEKDVQAILNEVVRRGNETVRRLRDIEEKDSLFENRLNTVETTALNLSDNKKVVDDKFTQKTEDLERSVLRIDNELMRISKLLEKMAKKSELKELESLISIYNPIKTNFITREELELILEERLKNVSV